MDNSHGLGNYDSTVFITRTVQLTPVHCLAIPLHLHCHCMVVLTLNLNEIRPEFSSTHDKNLLITALIDKNLLLTHPVQLIPAHPYYHCMVVLTLH